MFSVVRFVSSVVIGLFCCGLGCGQGERSVVGEYVPDAPMLHLVVDEAKEEIGVYVHNNHIFQMVLKYHIQSNMPMPDDVFIIIRVVNDLGVHDKMIHFPKGEMQTEMLTEIERYASNKSVAKWNAKFGVNKWHGLGEYLCYHPFKDKDAERKHMMANIHKSRPSPYPRPDFAKVKKPGSEVWEVIDKTGHWTCSSTNTRAPGEAGLIPQDWNIDTLVSLINPDMRNSMLPMEMPLANKQESRMLLVEYPFKHYNIGKPNTIRLSDYVNQ